MIERKIRCACGNLIKYNDLELGRRYDIFCNKCLGRHRIKENLIYCPNCKTELMSLFNKREKYCENCKKTFLDKK